MKTTKEFRFGISSWSYPWSVGVAKGPQPKEKLSAAGLLEKAKQLDVKLVQIADNLPLENLSSGQLNELRKKAQASGIALEIGTKGVEPDHVLRFLQIAQLFDSPVLRTLPAIFGKRVELDELEQKLLAVLPDFETAGITLVLENQEAYRVAELADLMNKINHPNLRICLDLANALGAMEGFQYTMQQLGPWCGNYHFKDVVIVRSKTLMGFSVEGRPSGQGSLPLRWALDEIKKMHADNLPSVIIELWPTPLQTIEETIALEEQWVAQSVEYMKTVSW